MRRVKQKNFILPQNLPRREGNSRAEKGPVLFAPAARRVPRTNWTCPLFGLLLRPEPVSRANPITPKKLLDVHHPFSGRLHIV